MNTSEDMGSGRDLIGDGTAQAVDLPLVLKDDHSRHAATLPVIHPLLKAVRLIQTKQASKSGVAACGFDDLGGFVCVHGDITHHV